MQSGQAVPFCSLIGDILKVGCGVSLMLKYAHAACLIYTFNACSYFSQKQKLKAISANALIPVAD